MKNHRCTSFVFTFPWLLLWGLSSVCPADEARALPNIVLILGDDMKRDHFGFINDKALTPNLDRLARDGVYFSRNYTPSAACTPSRFSSLTGRFASRCRSPGFADAFSKEGVSCVTWNTDLLHEPDILPRALKEAGYKTGIVGKWHNGEAGSYRKIRNQIDYSADPQDPVVAKQLEEMHAAMQDLLRGLGFDYAEGLIVGNYGDNPVGKLRFHNQEDLTRHAVTFIEDNRDHPFFLYLPTTLMHGPSPWKSLNSDPHTTFRGVLEEPHTIQPSREEVIARGRAAGIHDHIIPATWLDDGIGVILETLERLELNERTLVIFMDDHGMDGGKASCYEGGVKAPLLFYWPGTIAPGKSDALVANIDLYPTICELAEISYKPEKHDGQSLVPILKGTADAVRDNLYCEWGYTRAVVTSEWKYVALRIPPSKQLNEAQRHQVVEAMVKYKQRLHQVHIPMVDSPLSHLGYPGGYDTERSMAIRFYPHYYDPDQLYFLPDDPKEQTNLAGDARHKVKLRKMKAMLSEWVSRLPGEFGEF